MWFLLNSENLNGRIPNRLFWWKLTETQVCPFRIQKCSLSNGHPMGNYCRYYLKIEPLIVIWSIKMIEEMALSAQQQCLFGFFPALLNGCYLLSFSNWLKPRLTSCSTNEQRRLCVIKHSILIGLTFWWKEIIRNGHVSCICLHGLFVCKSVAFSGLIL